VWRITLKCGPPDMQDIILQTDDGCVRHKLAGAKQVAEKGTILGQMPEKHASGPEGPFDSMAVMYELKPVPFRAMSFSAACKAHLC